MTEMTEADRKAFEDKWKSAKPDVWNANYHAALAFWKAALTHARGKQEPFGYIVTESGTGEFCDPLEFSSQPLTDADKKAGFMQVAVYAAPLSEIEELARLREEHRLMCQFIVNGVELGYIEVPSAPAISKPKVKALVWSPETKFGLLIDKAYGLGGAYEVSAKVYSPGWVTTFAGREVIYDGDDEDEAYSAAQSDFERRILSAIERGEDE